MKPVKLASNKGLARLNFSKNLDGFTLLETIVALGVFTIAISAALTLANQSIESSRVAKARFIASSLAEEGIEGVRNKRDTNWLASLTGPDIDWRTGLSDGSYELNVSETGISFASNANRFLKFDSATGLYNYAGSGSTAYQRKIDISTVSADEMKVISTITWRLKSKNYSFVVEEHLFNWK
ncbi:MAG: type II secretion system protein [Parcubacteria group bacterium]|nr:type II secretion system protein [Parcubacteria group bacterium]